MLHRKPTMTGGFLRRCGRAACPCCPRANRILWEAIGPVSMLAQRWMPSLSCAALAARGVRWTPRESARTVPPTAAATSGERRPSSWPYGNRGWWHMTPGRALTGNGWRWTARGPKPRLGGEKVGKHPTDRGQSGTKRSVRTDGGGVPIGLAVAGTHRHDGTMARETIEPSAVERPAPTAEMPQGRCLDTG